MKLHPLSAVTRALQRGLVAAFFVTFLSSFLGFLVPDELTTGVVLATLGPLAFVAAAGHQIAYYYRFEYELTPDTFDISAGVFSRKEREIPYRRIQNVDITESIFHRLFGVAVLRVETAGGSSTEATLNFVAADEARRLQGEIRERRARIDRDESPEADADSAAESDSVQAHDPAEAAAVGPRRPPEMRATTGEQGSARQATESEPIFRLGEGELLVLALSSVRRAAVFVLAVGFPFFQDVVVGTVARIVGADVDPGTITGTPDLLLVAGLVTLVFGVVVSWVLSAAATFTEYYDFTLGRQGEDLVYDRGLLQRYSGSIPTDKVQTLAIRENVLMRLLGYAGLSVETAGYGPNQSSGGSQSAVPLAKREHTLSLARDVEPFGDVSFTRPPKVSRRRYAVRYLLAVGAVTAVFVAVARYVGDFSLWFTPLLLVPLVPVGAHLKWKHRGYHVGENYFVVRTGFWRRTTRVVPYYRLQTVIRSRSIFQRRLGIAHLTADTATSSTFGGRGATAYDIDAEAARQIATDCRERLQAALEA